ncbi:unnamed protein product [Spirodela intermedia]|uniref:Uncharacterized protein n=1 Tax=Spirodela intermedia TaxID=51605 RepID=A0A7I8KMA0_SPIIN|nr:unnamed protein product [Spirodela intermedia]
MGSPAIGILRSRHRSHRRPLQPKNTPSEPHRSSGGVKRGQSPRTIQSSPEDAIGGKENRPQELSAGIDPADTSLGKELVAVRRRRERIRSERERTEKLLIERSRMLDTAMRKAEDRWEAQLKMEAELRQVIRLRELGPSPSRETNRERSRERERERRGKREEEISRTSSGCCTRRRDAMFSSNSYPTKRTRQQSAESELLNPLCSTTK